MADVPGGYPGYTLQVAVSSPNSEMALTIPAEEEVVDMLSEDAFRSVSYIFEHRPGAVEVARTSRARS